MILLTSNHKFTIKININLRFRLFLLCIISQILFSISLAQNLEIPEIKRVSVNLSTSRVIIDWNISAPDKIDGFIIKDRYMMFRMLLTVRITQLKQLKILIRQVMKTAHLSMEMLIRISDLKLTE
jgi:hypothetical protein